VTVAERRVLLAERTARRVLGALLGNDPPDGEMTLYLSVMTMDDRPGWHRFGLLSPLGELEATVTVRARGVAAPEATGAA
jgi:hypothetical protein